MLISATWERTGNWSRDAAYENDLKAFYGETSETGQFTAATLDADPGSEFADLAFSLVCIKGSKVLLLTAYSGYVPPVMDAYLFGIWDYGADDWKSGAVEYYDDPFLNDIGSSIVIINNIQIRRMMEIVNEFHLDRNPGHVLTGGIYNSTNESEAPLLAEWDTTGITDALEYLGCY